LLEIRALAIASGTTVLPRTSTKSLSVTPRTARLKLSVIDVTARAVVAATALNVAVSGGGGSGAGGVGGTGGTTGGSPVTAVTMAPTEVGVVLAAPENA